MKIMALERSVWRRHGHGPPDGRDSGPDGTEEDAAMVPRG